MNNLLKGLLDFLFSKNTDKKQAQATVNSQPDAATIEARNKAFEAKFVQVKALFQTCLAMYNAESCPCAYPRFQQIIGIDCRNSGDSFKCFDTDLLIGMSKSCFDVVPSLLKDECTNEKWICKKCGSTYEYGWSDFSIAVDRDKLKRTHLAAPVRGRETLTPIPLYIGLMGHSYPPQSEMAPVDFETFQRYMLEQ